jgi:hypothetical protein
MYQKQSGRDYERLNKRLSALEKFTIHLVGFVVFAFAYFVIRVVLYWILT